MHMWSAEMRLENFAIETRVLHVSFQLEHLFLSLLLLFWFIVILPLISTCRDIRYDID